MKSKEIISRSEGAKDIEVCRDDSFSCLIVGFDSYSHNENGVEFWYARELQELLKYKEWRNFVKVIEKAKEACLKSKVKVSDHFVNVNKMVELGSESKRKINDYKLTRYACYLVAQNGDPSKSVIAFAQSYFSVQTRKQEIIERRMAEYERIAARVKLSESEKELSALSYEKGVDSKGFAIIRSEGDKALFGGYNTSKMKQRLGIKDSKPLADYLPSVTIKAKDLAVEMTNYKLKVSPDIKGRTPISKEHSQNNKNVRNALTDSGIYPEDLPAEEDIKKIRRKIEEEEKRIITGKAKRIDKIS
ncbi:MAG: DNA damage-inducible protein D [Holosporales bacterium]|jgi:DNA-damage-inducible protein D|nr:DNA damage-inducible protein D [Holosporales bacterium]